MGAGGICCPPDIFHPLERVYQYSVFGGLIQQTLYAALVVPGGRARLQVHATCYGSYIRSECEDSLKAKEFSTPAGAEPHFWYRCGTVELR